MGLGEQGERKEGSFRHRGEIQHDVTLNARDKGLFAPYQLTMDLGENGVYSSYTRDFIQSDGFQDIFDVDTDTMTTLLSDDEALLQFAYRFLQQVLFGETSISMKEGARERRLEQRQEIMKSRRDAAIAAHKKNDPTDVD